VETCTNEGQWQKSHSCNQNTHCNQFKTECISPIVPFELADSCKGGDTACYKDKKYTCVNGVWIKNTNSMECVNLTPTPTPSLLNDYGDCPLENGIPYCTQTNPKWSNMPFPNGCDVDSVNYWWRMGCGPSSTASILCKCDQRFCNIPHALEVEEDFRISCAGTTVHHMAKVLDKYKDKCDIAITKPIPAKVYDQESGVTYALYTEDIIKEILNKGGVLQVGGKFVFCRDNLCDKEINHITLISYNQKTGKLVVNDPFYNLDNPIDRYKIKPQDLWGYFKKTHLTQATLVKM
jgi:hypothetical protein